MEAIIGFTALFGIIIVLMVFLLWRQTNERRTEDGSIDEDSDGALMEGDGALMEGDGVLVEGDGALMEGDATESKPPFKVTNTSKKRAKVSGKRSENPGWEYDKVTSLPRSEIRTHTDNIQQSCGDIENEPADLLSLKQPCLAGVAWQQDENPEKVTLDCLNPQTETNPDRRVVKTTPTKKVTELAKTSLLLESASAFQTTQSARTTLDKTGNEQPSPQDTYHNTSHQDGENNISSKEFVAALSCSDENETIMCVCTVTRNETDPRRENVTGNDCDGAVTSNEVVTGNENVTRNVAYKCIISNSEAVETYEADTSIENTVKNIDTISSNVALDGAVTRNKIFTGKENITVKETITCDKAGNESVTCKEGDPSNSAVTTKDFVTSSDTSSEMVMDNRIITSCNAVTTTGSTQHDDDVRSTGSIKDEDDVRSTGSIKDEDDDVRSTGSIKDDDVRSTGYIKDDYNVRITGSIKDDDVTSTGSIKDDNVRSTGSIQDDDDVRNTGSIKDDDEIGSTGSIKYDDEIRSIGSIKDDDEIKSTGSIKDDDVRNIGSIKDDDDDVRSTGSIKDDSAIRSTGLIKDDDVRSTGSIKDDDVRSTGSIKDDDVRSTGSIKDDEDIGSTGFIKDNDDVRSTGFIKDDDVRNIVSIKDDEDDVGSIGSIKDDDEIRKTGSIKDDDDVRSIGYIKDDYYVRITGSIKDDDDVRSTGCIKDDDEIRKTGSIKDDDVRSTGFFQHDDIFRNTGSIKDDDCNVRSTWSIKDDDDVRNTGFIKDDDDDVRSIGSIKDDDVRSAGSIKDDDKIRSTGSIKDDDDVKNIGSIKDDDDVKSTGFIQHDDAVRVSVGTGEQDHGAIRDCQDMAVHEPGYTSDGLSKLDDDMLQDVDEDNLENTDLHIHRHDEGVFKGSLARSEDRLSNGSKTKTVVTPTHIIDGPGTQLKSSSYMAGKKYKTVSNKDHKKPNCPSLPIQVNTNLLGHCDNVLQKDIDAHQEQLSDERLEVDLVSKVQVSDDDSNCADPAVLPWKCDQIKNVLFMNSLDEECSASVNVENAPHLVSVAATETISEADMEGYEEKATSSQSASSSKPHTAQTTESPDQCSTGCAPDHVMRASGCIVTNTSTWVATIVSTSKCIKTETITTMARRNVLDTKEESTNGTILSKSKSVELLESTNETNKDNNTGFFSLPRKTRQISHQHNTNGRAIQHERGAKACQIAFVCKQCRTNLSECKCTLILYKSMSKGSGGRKIFTDA